MSTFYLLSDQQERVSAIEKSMEGLIVQKNYPCIAAVQSYFKKEYRLGLYKNFCFCLDGTQTNRQREKLFQFGLKSENH